MKKSERINDMLIFLNRKRKFNLKDLMVQYNISKSTALRDIQSLEEIGVPIFSDLGRNGSYTILENKILSPIYFNVDEMYALYFALLTLNGYKTKPFNYENIILENKFKNILPGNIVLNISRMEKILTFEVTNHSNFSPYLKEILQGIFAEKVYSLVYSKKEKKVRIESQFITIESKFGQWYAKIFDFKAESIKVLRCDKILFFTEIKNKNPKNLEELLSRLDAFHRRPDAIEFTVLVNQNGKDIFTKENYPSMKIKKKNENYVITGYFNQTELDFIANYFLRFGKTLISIQPEMLKNKVNDNVRSLLQHIASLE